MNGYWGATIDWLESTGARIGLILIMTFAGMILARILANRVIAAFMRHQEDDLETRKRIQTIGSLLRYAINITLILVAIFMILGELGIDIGPLLAAAGVAGIAIGFGVQHIVQDITNGFFIMIDDEIRVGDVVNIAGKGGVVERMNLRQVVLRDLGGNVHYVPNSKIDVVTNMTKTFAYALMDIGVAYREDIDQVTEVIKAVAEDLRNDEAFSENILEPVEILGLDQFADSAIIIKARIKTKPIKQWMIMREFNRRLKIAFDKQDIEIPFPHMTMYMGVDKQGQSPPLNIRNVSPGNDAS